MKAKKKKSKKVTRQTKKPTLASITALYKKRGFKRPRAHAVQYMAGYNAGKKAK